MKLALVSVRVPAHLYTMTTLARTMQSRGHEVSVIGIPDTAAYVQGMHVPFIPFCQEEYPLGSLQASMKQLGQLEGAAALAFTMQSVTGTLRAALQSLPEVLRKLAPDCVILDAVQADLSLVPMQLGIPFIHVTCALPLDLSGATPPCTHPWPYEDTPEARARNLEAVQQVNRLFEPVRAVAQQYAQQHSLQVDWHDPYATISKRLWITQTPAAFDFPGHGWPPQFRHAGPHHSREGMATIDFPWEKLSGKPLIYASMGTLQNGKKYVFQTIADAVRELPETQLVLSIGPAIQAEALHNLPAGTVVVNRAPQIELMQRAVLCINHAGLNSVLESLQFGVPMVCIPVTNDQPGVAARVAYTRTGAVLPIAELATERLRQLIRKVLAEPSYRANAQRLQREIEAEDGLNTAAGLIENAMAEG